MCGNYDADRAHITICLYVIWANRTSLYDRQVKQRAEKKLCCHKTVNRMSYTEHSHKQSASFYFVFIFFSMNAMYCMVSPQWHTDVLVAK